METGNKIKHFRLLKGLSQEKIAELLGITPKSYGNIERNITDVNISRLQQIAEVLGVSLPKLLDFDEKNVIYGNNNNHNIQGSTVQQSESEQIQNLTHSLNKSQQENQFLNEKIGYLEKEINRQQEIIELMKEGK